MDRIEHPDNFRNPPVNDLQREKDRLSGKFGFRYSPSRQFRMRGVYSEGMGGVTFDESVRFGNRPTSWIQPVYERSFRNLWLVQSRTLSIRLWVLALREVFRKRTWWGANLRIIEQDVIGRSVLLPAMILGFSHHAGLLPDSASQTLDYREVSHNLRSIN